MSELFFTVLELSYKSLFLILAVLILRLLLKKAPRRMICALWLLVGLRLLVPFSIESNLSLVPELQDSNEQNQLIVPEAEVEAEVEIVAPQLPTTANNPGLPQTAPGIQIISPSQPTQSPATASPIVNVPMEQEPEPKPLPNRETVAAIGWLCGVGVMLAYLFVSYIALQRSLGEAVPVGDGVWKCGAVSSPFVLGLFRPRVYISYGMSPEQTKYVLAHERSHIARRDHWTKFFGFLILSVHWFNPLVWLAYALLCRDIELACDEKAIRGMDAEGRKAYSLALLQCAVKASPLAVCPLAFGEVGVKQRIKSVLSYKKPTVWIILAALICGIAVGVFFLTDPRGVDCPKELHRAIEENLNSRYEKYELEDITEKNPLLYSFTYSIERNTVSIPAFGSSDTTTLPEYIKESHTEYAYLLDEGWVLAVSFGGIPGHILRGVPFDCPNAVWEVINGYLEARSTSMEAAQPYYYSAEDSHYNDPYRLLNYELEYVNKRNELLYSFKWSGKREYSDSDALYYRKTGERRNTSSGGIYYVFNMDGEWKIASMFSYIPGHILRGEATDTEAATPESYDCPDEVLDTYLRWIKAMSHGSGDFEVYKELTYLGEGVEPINPGISIADIVSDEIQSVTRVNDCLYEFISVYSLKYSEGEFGAQRFVGYVDGKWMLMLYDVVPTELQEGLENCDRWTWDNEGNQVIIPAHSYTDPELPVEAHLMDKLKFYLPTMHSCGVYDIYLGYAGGGVPIYYADGTLCGQMELNYAMEVRIDKGEIIFIDDGMNHASFISDLESIDHSVPCAVAEFSDDDGGSYWYVIFAKEDSAFCYALKLHTGYFSRDEAIRMAKAVRFTTEAFNSFDEIELLYWPIIDSYATALSRGLLPSEMTDAGLNWAVVDHCEDPLNEAGWTIEDVDGNDTPELLIGKQSFETGRGTPIYSLYTLDGEYIPDEVFSGFTRSMYYFIKDNYFHHHGSAGVGNDSDSYFEYSNGRLTELEGAPDTKVYGIYIRNFSSIMGYSSDYGVHFTGASPHVDISSYAGLSIYTPETGYSYAIESETYIAQMAAIVGSGWLSPIDGSEYMEAAASAPLTLLFESRNADESVSLFASPLRTYPKLCVETPEGCFYYDVSGDGLQPARELISNASRFSVNGSSFYYRVPELGLLEYDMTEYVASMDVISSARAVKDKLVLECHTGPKNAVHLIFDTRSRSFEKEIIGTNLTWYGDMLASAVYSFWEGVYNYNGELIKEYELKEDEFIRGLEFSENGRTLIVSIEGSGRIRQDIVTILNDDDPGLSMSTDLDMDGSDDSISLRGDGGLYIDGRVFLTGLGAADMESLSLYTADIVPEDGFLELAISRGGSDAETLFFRWDGQDVLYLGSIPAEYGDIEFHEGYCVAEFPCEVLPGWMLYGHWIVKNGELVLTNGMNSGMHYLFTRSSYNQDDSGDPVPHRLESSIVVYDGNEKPTKREVLPAGSTVTLMGCDNVEWLRIMSDNGASYWLHIDDGKLDTPSGARPIGDVIEGLGRD